MSIYKYIYTHTNIYKYVYKFIHIHRYIYAYLCTYIRDYLTDTFDTSDEDDDEGLMEPKVTICRAGWEGSGLYWLLSKRSSQWAALSITLRNLRMEWNNLQRKKKFKVESLV